MNDAKIYVIYANNNHMYIRLCVWLLYMIRIVAAKVPNLVLKGKQDQCDLIVDELTLAGLVMFLQYNQQVLNISKQ